MFIVEMRNFGINTNILNEYNNLKVFQFVKWNASKFKL